VLVVTHILTMLLARIYIYQSNVQHTVILFSAHGVHVQDAAETYADENGITEITYYFLVKFYVVI